MKYLKYGYLVFGIFFYIYINYITYTIIDTDADLSMSILFSMLSFVLLMLDYTLILIPHFFIKKPFQNFTLHTKILLYAGVVIIPLISLYYT